MKANKQSRAIENREASQSRRAAELVQSFEDEIRRLFTVFERQSEIVGAGLVEHANTARQIGVLLQEWQGLEQITFDFFREHEKQLPFGFDAAKHFVAIARGLDEPATTVEDVRRVLQLDFMAAGLLTVPTGGNPGQINSTPMLLQFSKALDHAREIFQKWVEDEPIATWTTDRRTLVRDCLKPIVDLYNRLGSTPSK